MRISHYVCCAVVWVVLTAIVQVSPASAGPKLEALEERAFQQAVALIGPSIVRIQTVGGVDRVGGVLTATGPTTGVVVSADGYVISSAFNFIARPASILVQLSNGRRYPAVNVATDRSKMLTLLKIEESGLAPATAAPKPGVRVGQWAVALGRTYDTAEPSVSVGIVSALGRVWGKALQTDAKVSPVNYGGPLVNVEGQVLGVLVPLSPQENEETAGVEWYDSGIGFAIPMEDVYAAFERLKAGKDLKPGLMGITFKPGSLSARSVIDRVRFDSPAEKAGLKPGDVISEVDGRGVRRPDEVKQVLGGKYAGDSVALAVRRGDQTVRATLTLVAELKPYEPGFLGVLPLREEQGSGAPKGVGVRFVYGDSPALSAGIAPRDRILRLNNAEVSNASALADLVSRSRPGSKVTIVFEQEKIEKTAEVALASVPHDVPAELRSAPIPPHAKGAAAPPAGAKPANESPQKPADGQEERGQEERSTEERKTGRFTVELPGHERGYWAYVPEDYNPKYQYGLMVWLQPSGDGMEAEILQKWTLICATRGVLLVAPKPADAAGWNPAETGFVKDVIEHFSARYPVDRSRTFVHTFASGGPFACTFAFKHREMVRGVCLASAPLGAAPAENHPDHRVQFHFVCGQTDETLRVIEASAALLRQLKFPVSLSVAPDRGRKYPAGEQLEEMGRWADSLDRI